MKTKQQIKEKLYKSYFIDRKRNNTIALGLFISLIITIIYAILKNSDIKIDLMVFGLLGFIIYNFVSIWFFFKPYHLDKEKTKIYKKIDELEKAKKHLQSKFDDIFGNKSLETLNTQEILWHIQAKLNEERKINKLQTKIWRLEFEIEMLGGTNRTSR